MSHTAATQQHQTWTRDDYLTSTDPSLIHLATLSTWFASPDMHWTNPLPPAILRVTLENSLCFGLHKHQATSPGNLELVGFARCVTDHVTFVYLTDVYVRVEDRGKGLGKWLIKCVRERVDEMTHLRRSVLLTGGGKAVGFYERVLGMSVYEGPREDGLTVMMRKGRGHPEYEAEGSGERGEG